LLKLAQTFPWSTFSGQIVKLEEGER